MYGNFPTPVGCLRVHATKLQWKDYPQRCDKTRCWTSGTHTLYQVGNRRENVTCTNIHCSCITQGKNHAPHTKPSRNAVFPFNNLPHPHDYSSYAAYTKTPHFSLSDAQWTEYQHFLSQNQFRGPILDLSWKCSHRINEFGLIVINEGTAEFTGVSDLFQQINFGANFHKWLSEEGHITINPASRGNDAVHAGYSHQNIRSRTVTDKVAIPGLCSSTTINIPTMIILSKICQRVRHTILTYTFSICYYSNNITMLTTLLSQLDILNRMQIDTGNREAVLRNTLFARSIHPENIFEGLTSAISAPAFHQLKCHVDSFNDPNPLYDICVMASIMFLDTTDAKQAIPKVLRPINIAYFRKSCHDFMKRWSDCAKVRYITLDALEKLPYYRKKQITPHSRVPVQTASHNHGYYHRDSSIDPCSFVSLYVDAITKLRTAFPNLSLHQSASLFIPVAVGVAPQIVHSIYTMWISRGRLPTGPLIVAVFFKQCTQSRFQDIPGWLPDDPRCAQQLQHISVKQMIELCANIIRVHTLFSCSGAPHSAVLTINDLVVNLRKGTDRKLPYYVNLCPEASVTTALCMLLTRFIDNPSMIFEPERTLITKVNTVLKQSFEMGLDHSKTLSLVTSVSLSLSLPLRLGCNAIILALTPTRSMDYFHNDQSLFTASNIPPVVTEYTRNSHSLLLPQWTPTASEADARIFTIHQSGINAAKDSEAVYLIPSPLSNRGNPPVCTADTNIETDNNKTVTSSKHYVERMLFAGSDETRPTKRPRVCKTESPDSTCFINVFFPESLSKTSSITLLARGHILRNLFESTRLPCAPVDYVRCPSITGKLNVLSAPTPFASSQLVPPNSIHFDELRNEAYFLPGDCIPEMIRCQAANNTAYTVSYFDVNHLLHKFSRHLQEHDLQTSPQSHVPQHFPLGTDDVRFQFLPNPSVNMRRLAELQHLKDVRKIIHFSVCLRAICYHATQVCKTSFFRFVRNKTRYKTGHHIFLADMSIGSSGKRGREYVPMFAVLNDETSETLRLRFPGVLHTPNEGDRVSTFALSITR